MEALQIERLLGKLNDVEEKHAPSQLFTDGNLELLKRGSRVAVVGSRKASAEGLARTRRISRMLVQNDSIVVSGLALGIDTAAHRTAIENAGRTIAVIGTPLSKTYPKENADLQKKIASEHLLVSQFAVGEVTQKSNFPIRNRTMALLSDATVIVEASNSSGSLSQGWEALRLGRRLFIAHSLVHDPKLTWPSKMLDYGASVLSDETVPEFLEFLKLAHRDQRKEDEELPF